MSDGAKNDKADVASHSISYRFVIRPGKFAWVNRSLGTCQTVTSRILSHSIRTWKEVILEEINSLSRVSRLCTLLICYKKHREEL